MARLVPKPPAEDAIKAREMEDGFLWM